MPLVEEMPLEWVVSWVDIVLVQTLTEQAWQSMTYVFLPLCLSECEEEQGLEEDEVCQVAAVASLTVAAASEGWICDAAYAVETASTAALLNSSSLSCLIRCPSHSSV